MKKIVSIWFVTLFLLTGCTFEAFNPFTWFDGTDTATELVEVADVLSTDAKSVPSREGYMRFEQLEYDFEYPEDWRVFPKQTDEDPVDVVLVAPVVGDHEPAAVVVTRFDSLGYTTEQEFADYILAENPSTLINYELEEVTPVTIAGKETVAVDYLASYGEGDSEPLLDTVETYILLDTTAFVITADRELVDETVSRDDLYEIISTFELK